MSRRSRSGVALIEALGAALLLAILGLMAASHTSAQIELLRRERAFVDARALAEGLDWQLRRAFTHAGVGATSVAWHFEGIEATLALPSSGTLPYPAPLPFLTAAAPRWVVFPSGQPRRDATSGAYYLEGGEPWIVVDPVRGTPELAPTAPGWDTNENGVVDRPDILAVPPKGDPTRRALGYAIAITAPATPGDPYRVDISVYRSLAFRPVASGGTGVLEVTGVDRLVVRTLELRPGRGS